MYKISVIISTWRRPYILAEVLGGLQNQTLPPEQWEVIVVDSNSNDETSNIVLQYKTHGVINLQIVDAEINAVSTKRNVGIKMAEGCFIVFLDDDCVPEPDHLEVFLNQAEISLGQRIAWCGGVKFQEGLVKKSNYYRYRNGCHFSKNRVAPARLQFQSIVTMNLLIERSLLLRDNIKFNETFIGYGFEDIQFGIDLTLKEYILLPVDADIIHKELSGDVVKFRKKFFHSARDGMPVFKKISPSYVDQLGHTAWLESPEHREKNSKRLFRFLLHKILDSRLPKVITWLLLRTDKIPFLYSRFAFRLALAGAYREGVKARVSQDVIDAKKVNESGWYS